MFKQSIRLLLALLLLFCVLSGCSTPTAPAEPTPAPTPTPAPKDPFALCGTWEPSAVFTDDTIYTFAQVPALADLYDTNYLIFDEDGSFLYINGAFFTEGFADLINPDGLYLLTCTSAYRYELVDGEMVKKESESDTIKHYAACVLEGLNGGFLFGQCTMDNGSFTLDELLLLFEKKSDDSNAPSSTETPQVTQTPKPEKFTNKYGTPTTICAVSGCSNYIASSGDSNCCTTHSNKCLNCRCYIDGDAMYCMSCLTASSNTSSSKFTNKYGSPTTICAVSGCSNYIASSGDSNCCTTHSNKCLNCRCYIDGDAMYCMSCLTGA